MDGISVDGVTSWFTAHVAEVAPPLEFDLIAGGHSNLTFRVSDTEGRQWVLRRPPLHQVLATAHDMGREFRIITALAPTDVPVAPTFGICTDDTTNGAPFYVMEYVDGVVVRTGADTAVLDADARAAASQSLVDTLVRIHTVDIDAIGIGDLGRRDAYIERQLKRWQGQFEKSKTREVPSMDLLFGELSARIPPQRSATIVHGDYRLDNCIVGPDGLIRAVLDWELCTLGDPLADVGVLYVYWGEANSHRAIPGAPTIEPGFWPRDQVLERYAKASGRDLEAIDFYVAFAYWKLACIVEGVYARYVGGAMGANTDPAVFAPFAQQVEALADMALGAVARLP